MDDNLLPGIDGETFKIKINKDSFGKKDDVFYEIAEHLNKALMEEQQYYTPAPEDFRLGYEYEIYQPNINKWYKTAIRELMNDSDGDGGFSNAHYQLVLKYGKPEHIRVPYLTAKQIEAEGWSTCKWGWEKKIATSDTTFKWYYLDKNGDSSYIIMNAHDNVLYHGKIPSINEFRFITKLLGL